MDHLIKFVKLHFKKFIKYFFVGGFATLIYLFGLYLFTDILHMYYLISAIIAFCISTIIAYFAHKYLTFQNLEKKHKQQFSNFLAFAILGLLINLTTLYITVNIFSLWYMLGAILASAIAFVVNYFLNYYITFRAKF